MLGDEIGTIHSRKELSELLRIHVQHGAIDVETGREVAGAMNYKEHTVREVMTPVKDCFMLSVSEKLNFKVGLVCESVETRRWGEGFWWMDGVENRNIVFCLDIVSTNRGNQPADQRNCVLFQARNMTEKTPEKKGGKVSS